MASNDENPPAPANEKITLKSSDGRNFAISKSAAALSATINKKLSRAKPPKPNEVPLNNIDGDTLHLVVTYLSARAAAGDDELKKKKADEEFLPGEPEVGVLLNVAVAADCLGIQGLADIVSGKIAESMKIKPVEWVRKVSKWKNQCAWAFEGVDPDDEE